MEKEASEDTPLITQRLNELLETKHLSKADMARIAGVSRASVNGWFKRGSISKEAALKIANSAGVSLSWVLGEDVSTDEYSEDERKLIELYRELPGMERANMLAVFEMRLQELKRFYGKYFEEKE